eukprot:scpid81499/ scgid30010/ 
MACGCLRCALRYRRTRSARYSLYILALLSLVTLALIARRVVRHEWANEGKGAAKPLKSKVTRSRLERDPVSLLKRMPLDPLLGSRSKKHDWPKNLHLLRVSVFTGPMLLTAPHGIPLWRGDKLKGNEPGTSSVAWRSAFMDPLRGVATALTWRDISVTSELSRSRSQQPILDPNYLLPQETFLEPWSVFLRAHFREYGDQAVLVDVHGMADGHGSDCTIGIAPWNRTQPAEATRCQQCIQERLAAVFPAFRFKQLPYFTGDWDDRVSARQQHGNGNGNNNLGRMTLSRQAAHLGMRAVQLEMTMRLRNAIIGAANTTTTDPPGPRIGGWHYGKLQEFADTLRVCVLRLASAGTKPPVVTLPTTMPLSAHPVTPTSEESQKVTEQIAKDTGGA